jgi:streptogramin lyase
VRLTEYPVPGGSHPHDVGPAADGTVWYTAPATGRLARLDPKTGRTEEIPLGDGSAPHGVIVGPDGAPWITDGGLNAIVRVDPATRAVHRFPLPADRPAVNLNTATFDRRGRLWFTGQGGVYGSLDPRGGRLRVFDAPGGAGPYGITTTPDGEIYYASLAGSHLARIDPASGKATVLEPPTPGQGARRVWSDSAGRLWVSEWNAGRLGRYDPAAGRWQGWPLPGQDPSPMRSTSTIAIWCGSATSPPTRWSASTRPASACQLPAGHRRQQGPPAAGPARRAVGGGVGGRQSGGRPHLPLNTGRGRVRRRWECGGCGTCSR